MNVPTGSSVFSIVTKAASTEALDRSTDLIVRMDGIELSGLSTPQDVIDAARSDPEDAIFYLVHTGEVAQLLVYVPNFSTHEIVISLNPSGYGSLEWGLAVFGAVGIICLAGHMVVRRT
ncbi:MAG: hypothetical protein LLG16_03010 [Euryarchaeota archaeon]|nr:hypothetical protein [Euryarchaeota archaeon]